MAKLLECVPNISEGRDPSRIESARAALAADSRITVLDVAPDESHHRTVLTFAGPPEAMEDAILRLFAEVLGWVDLRSHKGEHPRMGAVDVVPFVPLGEATMADCVALAESVARSVANRFHVPVYLYAEAARVPERKVLAHIRKGEFEGLAAKMADPAWTPDFGPAAPHPTAGAVAIGARPFLIAYNLHLNTRDVRVAQDVAKAVRASGGGLANVQAMGVHLADRDVAQVSMNLLDHRKTPLRRVQELVKAEAARFGAKVTDAEIIGLIPQEALIRAAADYLQLPAMPTDLILEERLRVDQASPEPTVPQSFYVPDRIGALTLAGFLSDMGARQAVPGGGCAAAYAGAMGAALVGMVGALTEGRKGFEGVAVTAENLREQGADLSSSLLRVVAEDAGAFDRVMEGFRMPKSTEEERQARTTALEEANRGATEVPLAAAREALAAAELALSALGHGVPQAASDAGCGALLSLAAVEGALLNVAINLGGLADGVWAAERRTEAVGMLVRAARLREELWTMLRARVPVIDAMAAEAARDLVLTEAEH
ncbi:MAG: glutamate formimidoyltransferase [Candidatus Sericytochromatia bacterium]|nr:glutamate formimidoyltransferase [Candidatus Sericytochromatia bacterium]